ncbi:MAG: tetratricopeptide repeat protein, partial [Dokdonella sp.]
MRWRRAWLVPSIGPMPPAGRKRGPARIGSQARGMLARTLPHPAIGRMNPRVPPATTSVPAPLQAQLARGNACLDRGAWAEAEACFAAALRLAPGHPQLQLSRALALQGLGRPGEALVLL